jgi:epoxyqueuosine reductase
MAYLERSRDKRVDPDRVLPGARSVVACALSYFQGPAAAGPAGVARYAWGDDYHAVMGPRLQALADTVARLAPGSAALGYVDTGPLLERDLAARAGLGWIGKNTMLLHPREGSWLFLGEILLTADLVPDLPAPDRCGSCTRCMDACPTDAFPAPYLLDANRCIGYLTVELKGPIPRAQRSALGDRVFGCDDCQDVCPWNRKAARAPHPPGAAAGLSLAPLFDLDEAGFRERFRETALSRAKRRGILRNAAVVLGNRRDASAVPALVKGLRDPEPLVRAHAAWALGEIGNGEAASALARAARSESDPAVREEIALALEAAGR